ncbi:hypothetical protein, partial [Salmonella enterica]|uniref:hypothetical protein n=1 Tax=Salmonella enterica TaxID=28901 RepID=UPI0039EB69B2
LIIIIAVASFELYDRAVFFKAAITDIDKIYNDRIAAKKMHDSVEELVVLYARASEKLDLSAGYEQRLSQVGERALLAKTLPDEAHAR